MKQLYLILSLLLSLPLAAMAQDEDEKNYLVTDETTCQPKPYIHFTFPKGDGIIYSNTKLTNLYKNKKLRNKSTFTYTLAGEETANDIEFFVSYEKGTLTYYLADNVYLPSGASKVTITTPNIMHKVVGGDTTLYTGKTYEFTVEPSLKISKSCKSSEITLNKSMTVIVPANCVLTVDNEFSIPNLIVEAGNTTTYGGGVVVESNGNLAVADTAYFLCHTSFHRNNAYLINRGTFSASGSIFTKYIDNGVFLPYAKLYGYLTEKGNIDAPHANMPIISFPVKTPNKTFGFMKEPGYLFQVALPYSEYYGGSLKSSYYLSKEPYLTDFSNPNQYMYVLNYDVSQAAVFRANGDINDEESYSVKVEEKATATISHETKAVIDNPYQACIDWSVLIADEENNAGLAQKLRCVNFNYGHDHMSCDFNFATGLTTYDGPMQFGYLQPAMEQARFFQLDLNEKDNITVNLDKKYLTSYAEMANVEPQVKVPYVRFYVDGVECPKGVGNRSVFVAYFLTAEEYEQVATSTDDEVYNDYFYLDPIWEVWSPNELYYNKGNTYGGAYFFPYIGSFRDGGANGRIRAFTLPKPGESGYCQGFTLYLEEKQTNVKYGILDYGNMDNIQFECLGLLLNAQDGRADVLEGEFDETANATKKEFDVALTPSGATSAKTYMYNDVQAKQVGMKKQMKLTNYNNDATSDANPVINTLKVVSVAGGITVSSTEPSNVNVVNLSGILVNNANVEGSTFIALPAGLYIVKSDNGKASKVIVK